jgi:beta-galactosidase
VLGVRVEELHPLPAGATVALSTGDSGDHWSEHLHLAGAQPVARYVGGVLDGCPALTRHRYGSGSAWYVSTRLDEPGLSRLLAEVCQRAGVATVRAGLPPGVEVVRRGRFLFVLNHGPVPASVTANGTDLVSGAVVEGSIAVPPGGYAVVREPAADGG